MYLTPCLVLITFKYKIRQIRKTRFIELPIPLYQYIQKPKLYEKINISIHIDNYISHITNAMIGTVRCCITKGIGALKILAYTPTDCKGLFQDHLILAAIGILIVISLIPANVIFFLLEVYQFYSSLFWSQNINSYFKLWKWWVTRLYLHCFIRL